MDRRKAIKNIGTGIGAITLTPSIAAIFQGCQSSKGYTPIFISKKDFNSISQIMELIIPTTDTPGAIELKLPEFLDAYVDAVWSQDLKDSFSKGWGAFKNDALNSINVLSNEEKELIVSYEKSSLNISEIIKFLNDQNIKISDISTEDADLEDVFIKLTKN